MSKMEMLSGGVLDQVSSLNSPAGHIGSQSPVDLKPDLSQLSPFTPNYLNSTNKRSTSPSGNYPPNNPLSGCKHFCSICGDRASGKHYGVYSCEGCKGFFKRTVRKELSYQCRENRDCIIDKRQRNRCQFCRYTKCLATGMRREAVQDERHRGSGSLSSLDYSSEMSNNIYANELVSVEPFILAEDEAEVREEDLPALNLSESQEVSDIKRLNLVQQQIMHKLIKWAKNVPWFNELCQEDQVTLIRGGWNELLIAALAFRSIHITGGIVLGGGIPVVERSMAHVVGLENIFDRILDELVSKMKEMHMDKAELGCLRAIILFNSEVLNLRNPTQVEVFRDRVYMNLEHHIRSSRDPPEPSRFAKLLLRLPTLRSIGLKNCEHLFFAKLIGVKSIGIEDTKAPLDQFIRSVLINNNNNI